MGLNGEEEREFELSGQLVTASARAVGAQLSEAKHDAILLVSDQAGRIYRVAGVAGKTYKPTGQQVIVLSCELIAGQLEDVMPVGGGQN